MTFPGAGIEIILAIKVLADAGKGARAAHQILLTKARAVASAKLGVVKDEATVSSTHARIWHEKIDDSRQIV